MKSLHTKRLNVLMSLYPKMSQSSAIVFGFRLLGVGRNLGVLLNSCLSLLEVSSGSLESFSLRTKWTVLLMHRRSSCARDMPRRRSSINVSTGSFCHSSHVIIGEKVRLAPDFLLFVCLGSSAFARFLSVADRSDALRNLEKILGLLLCPSDVAAASSICRCRSVQ